MTPIIHKRFRSFKKRLNNYIDFKYDSYNITHFLSIYEKNLIYAIQKQTSFIFDVLRRIILYQDTDNVKKILDHGFPINYSEHDMNLLYYASNSKNIINLLLNYGINTRSISSCNALRHASIQLELENVEILLKSGIHPFKKFMEKNILQYMEREKSFYIGLYYVEGIELCDKIIYLLNLYMRIWSIKILIEELY